MFYKADELRKYVLSAVDGEIGKIEDLYFDDRFWIVRYVVANAGGWLGGRLVVLSPHAIVSVDPDNGLAATNLTKAQIENGPSPDEAVPVSRQFETAASDYFGWPQYWYGAGDPWAVYGPPIPIKDDVIIPGNESWESNLRSAKEVTGYKVAATDGDIGHVADFVIDQQNWAIRYLVVDTRDWWPGKHVLVSWRWAESVSWWDREISVRLSRDAIKRAPEYDRDTVVTREYEIALCRHYGREGYWTEEGCDPESD